MEDETDGRMANEKGKRVHTRLRRATSNHAKAFGQLLKEMPRRFQSRLAASSVNDRYSRLVHGDTEGFEETDAHHLLSPDVSEESLNTGGVQIRFTGDAAVEYGSSWVSHSIVDFGLLKTDIDQARCRS